MTTENQHPEHQEQPVPENLPSETNPAAVSTPQTADTASTEENQPETKADTGLDATTSQDDSPAAEVLQPESSDKDIATKEPAAVSSDAEPATDLGEDEMAAEHRAQRESDEQEAENRDRALDLAGLLHEMELIINAPEAGAESKRFSQLKQLAQQKIAEESAAQPQQAITDGEAWQHPAQSKISALGHIFREKQDAYHTKQQAEEKAGREQRNGIIEKLKNLYTNTEPGTNLFRAIRAIKEEWASAGKVSRAEFKLLNNNYLYHLNQFYQMLDLNKDYLLQEYNHNLEKRKQIISRAKELETEPSTQKALNELQYLHKLWREEAEPVAEEFREKTWEEFREISNRIHDRKAELSAQLEAEQAANLERKNSIIAEIKALAEGAAGRSHSQWQQTIKTVEDLREQFLKVGSVPRKLSNQNWDELKQTLRLFNTTKNEFYKNLKGSQLTNLERKTALIQTAKEHMNSEDWDTAVPVFKNLQEEWKSIGHVPRNQANKVWDEFREVCNVFFDNYRKNRSVSGDNWKENYKIKKGLLEELTALDETADDTAAKVEAIQTKWNTVGKVPRDKMNIQSEFNKLLKEKFKTINVSSTGRPGTEVSAGDRARKLRNQIAELENEIVTLETNLGFFSKPTRENPMLKDTFSKIDSKKVQLNDMKESLHSLIKAGE